MLTQRGVALLAGAALAWFVARLLGINEFYVVTAAAVALVVLAYGATRLSGSTVAVRRLVSANRLQAGGTASVTLELRNDARLPTSVLLVEDTCPAGLVQRGRDATRFVVPAIAAGADVDMRYGLVGGLRGRYVIGPTIIGMRDPFGLVMRTRRSSLTDEVIVYPRIDRLQRGPARGAHRGSGASDSRRLFNTGDEFYTLREYASGDDLRQVHWPSTAHRQTLMVRQHEMPWETQGVVFCDTRRRAHTGSGPHATLERAVSAAASVIWHLVERGYRLRLVTEADPGPPSGSEPRNAMLDRLAVLEATREPSLAPALQRLRSGAGEGVLIGVLPVTAGEGAVTGDPDLRALLHAGRSFNGRLALLVSSRASGAGERERADAMATLLRAAGWRVATLAPGRPLRDAWQELGAFRPGGASAYRPGAPVEEVEAS